LKAQKAQRAQKRKSCSLCAFCAFWLLVAKDDDGINAHSALCRNQAREESYRTEDSNDHHKRKWIGWRNTKKHVLNKARQTKRRQHSNHNANTHEHSTTAHDQFQDRSWPSAECHSNSDL